MPGFDRTGPEGQGSQTGRRLGKCNPNKTNNDEQSTTVLPIGKRKGRGQGRENSDGYRLRRGRED